MTFSGVYHLIAIAVATTLSYSPVSVAHFNGLVQETRNSSALALELCSKTCLATVLIRSIFAQEKLHQRECSFSAQNRTN